jgi:hypothetical protein
MQVSKLSVDSGGRVTGTCPNGQPVQHNSPSWPCRNGDSGGMAVPSSVLGMLVHTMAGNLQPGTVAWFNNRASQASAHFGVSQTGEIWQFGPVNGWKAWHAAEGNPRWFGCEFADDGQPSNPLTQAQITAGAQLLELLSRDNVGRFPMQISDSPGTEGLGWHGMGGAAFGGHLACPGDIRKAQRPQIIALAVAIRQDTPAPGQNWSETMIANLPTLVQGAADKAGEAQMVHRMQALVRVIGDINRIPAASAVAANGSFDRATWTGVLALQKFFGLTQNGAVDEKTWAALVAGQHG